MSMRAWNWKSAKKWYLEFVIAWPRRNITGPSAEGQWQHIYAPEVCVYRTMHSVRPVLCEWLARGVWKLCRPSEVLLHSNTGLTTSSCGGCRPSLYAMYALKHTRREVNSCRWATLLLYENTIALFGWSSLACPQILEMSIPQDGKDFTNVTQLGGHVYNHHLIRWSHVIHMFLKLDFTNFHNVSLLIYLTL